MRAGPTHGDAQWLKPAGTGNSCGGQTGVACGRGEGEGEGMTTLIYKE